MNLSQYQHPLGTAAVERLERLARADNIGALCALRDGDYPQRDEVLTRLLTTFPEPPEQLRRYFRQHSVAESGPYWLELLRQHPKSADLPRILKSTYRVDLGSDPRVWEAWLKRRSANADERLQRLPDRDPARVLLQGWLGRLEPKDLAGQPRLVRLVAEPARLLDCQWLETLGGHHELIPLGPGEPVLLGPERVAVDRTSGRQAWLGSGGLMLRDLNGSTLPTLEGKFSNESIFQFFGRGSWLVADQEVVDLSKRQTMRLPGSGAYLFLDGQSGPTYMARRNIPVWNLHEERALPGLSTVLACDGRGYVVREKKHHVAYDLQGRSLGRVDSSSFEIHGVGPGARWALVGRHQIKFEAKDFPLLLWTPGREPEPVPGIGGNLSVMALSPDGARMHAVDIEAGQEEIYEVPQFKRVACWPWRGSWSQFSSDHRYLSVRRQSISAGVSNGESRPVATGD